MKLLTFGSQESPRLGVVTPQGVLDVAAATASLASGGDAPAPFDAERVPTDAHAFYRTGDDALPALRELVALAEKEPSLANCFLQEADVDFGPCVPQPSKIICVGLNYRRHAQEAGATPPATPILFSKFPNTLAAAEAPVPLPSVGVEYDYEAELVAVIGKRVKDVYETDALDAVLGYCNGNDVSARDLQRLTGQWLLGKTLDGFMPTGPYLVTSDEVGDPQGLSIRCWLNGELRQDSHTSDMIFSVAEIVSYVSRHMTLEPGDMISTGTPEGVILGMKDKAWMAPGDEVRVEIGNLGRLVNPMVAES